MAQEDDEITEILYRHIPGWLVLCFVLGIVGLIATVALLHKTPPEEDPCDRYTRLRDNCFTGRILDWDYQHGNLTDIRIRSNGKRYKIYDVDPELAISFVVGDSIRKLPGSLQAAVSDAHGTWHSIDLFVCPDTTGCRLPPPHP